MILVAKIKMNIKLRSIHNFVKSILLLTIIIFYGCKTEIVKKLTDIDDLKKIEVIKRFGYPTEDNYFYISHKSYLFEYQGDLASIIDTVGQNDSVLINEMKWEFKTYTQVIWLKKSNCKWVVFDNLYWTSGIQF